MKRRATPRKRWQPLERAVVSDPEAYERAGRPDEVWRNDRYSVFVRYLGVDRDGALHLSFHRHDRAAVRDWRHFQAIKNEVAGRERLAVEVFPPESILVDAANEYHLWVVPTGAALPFMYQGKAYVLTPDEMVAENGGPTRARQRAWEAGIPTGRGCEGH